MTAVRMYVCMYVCTADSARFLSVRVVFIVIALGGLKLWVCEAVGREDFPSELETPSGAAL